MLARGGTWLTHAPLPDKAIKRCYLARDRDKLDTGFDENCIFIARRASVMSR